MIAAIEDGMVALIETASAGDVLGYKLRTVTTYGGELDDELPKIAMQFPAVWIVFAGERSNERGGGRFKSDATFTVIVATKNYRNERASRHGAGVGEVGSYQLIKDMRALLVGRNLGLEIDPLAPVAVRPLFNGKLREQKASIFAIEFRTGYMVDATSDDTPGSFKHFHADWDIPPHGDHDAVPLPEGTADATDDVQLAGA